MYLARNLSLRLLITSSAGEQPNIISTASRRLAVCPWDRDVEVSWLEYFENNFTALTWGVRSAVLSAVLATAWHLDRCVTNNEVLGKKTCSNDGANDAENEWTELNWRGRAAVFVFWQRHITDGGRREVRCSLPPNKPIMWAGDHAYSPAERLICVHDVITVCGDVISVSLWQHNHSIISREARASRAMSTVNASTKVVRFVDPRRIRCKVSQNHNLNCRP